MLALLAGMGWGGTGCVVEIVQSRREPIRQRHDLVEHVGVEGLCVGEQVVGGEAADGLEGLDRQGLVGRERLAGPAAVERGVMTSIEGHLSELLQMELCPGEREEDDVDREREALDRLDESVAGLREVRDAETGG